jgi:mannosyltransferase
MILNHRLHLVLVGFVVLVVNLVLKVWFVESQSIAGDEPFSIYMAGMRPQVIISHLMTGNNPPLWELLLHYWTRLFGIGPFAVRILSVLFSSLTAVVILMLGKEIRGLRVGVVASLLFTFSNYHVMFSHEARCYALFALLTSVSMLLFVRILFLTSRSWWYILGLSVVNGLLIYTHFFGFWVLFVQSVLSIWSLTRNGVSKQRGYSYLISLIISLIGYFPYVSVLFHRFSESASKGTWLSPPNGIDGMYTMLWNFSNQPVVVVVCILLLSAGLMHICWKGSTPLTLGERVVIFWFLLPFILMFLFSYVVPMWLDRYLIFVTPAYYLSLALLADRLFSGPRAFTLLAGVLVLLFLVTLNPNVSNKRDLRGVVSRIKELRVQFPNANVLICPEWAALGVLYHWDMQCFSQPTGIENFKANVYPCLTENGIYGVAGAGTIEAQKIGTSSHIIYLDAAADFVYPSNGIAAWLQSSFDQCESFEYFEIFRISHCFKNDEPKQ